MNKIKCKDIPEKPVLQFIADLNGRWATWFGDEFENSVTLAMPTGISNKLVLAKMSKMIRKGLVRGCTCGCRGDFEITQKGMEFLEIKE